MGRTCSRRGCAKKVSSARAAAGLSTCAEHGRKLPRGNPTLRRPERRLCKHQGCFARLSGARLEHGLTNCCQHGGPVPAVGHPGLQRRCRAFLDFVQAADGPSQPSIASPLCPRRAGVCPEEQLLNVLLRRRTGLSGEASGWWRSWQPTEVSTSCARRCRQDGTICPSNTAPQCARPS